MSDWSSDVCSSDLQLACADLVLLNKADLLDDAATLRVQADVAAHLRPGVKTMLLQHGVIDAAVLLGLQAAAEDDIAARRSHHDSEDGEHDHDDFASFAVSLPEQADPQALLNLLAPVIARHYIPLGKGFVAVAGKPKPLGLQGGR